MRAISEAGGPQPSSELAKKVCIESRQVRGYSAWLLKNNYVSQTMRKVPRVVCGVTALVPVAYWGLQVKGVEYLAGKNPPGNPQPSTV
jgi:hypothetical protein